MMVGYCHFLDLSFSVILSQICFSYASRRDAHNMLCYISIKICVYSITHRMSQVSMIFRNRYTLAIFELHTQRLSEILTRYTMQ